MQPTLKATIQAFPHKPGCYLFYDQAGDVIYVGKAKDLKKRVDSYFRPHPVLDPWKRRLLTEIATLNHVVVSNELEALLFESTLIKRFKPKFNVMLKDDKNYLWIEIGDEVYPQLRFVRRITPHGKKRYFGPYTNAFSIRATLRILRRIFPYSTCGRNLDGKHPTPRPCLHYYLKLCPGACIGAITPQVYQKNIDRVTSVLSGRTEEARSLLTAMMERASREERFEAAAKLRDQITLLDAIALRQYVITPSSVARDVLGIARNDATVVAHLLIIRGGKVLGSERFLLTDALGAPPPETITRFLKQYYARTENIPKEIIIEHVIEERSLIETWLTHRSGHAVYLLIPKRGIRKKLLRLSIENAKEYARTDAKTYHKRHTRITKGLNELTSMLHLPRLPQRIEAFDVSNIQGTSMVASMVVLIDGEPAKGLYRKFKIKTLIGANDPAAMAEVLRRRFTHLTTDHKAPLLKSDESFSQTPDLVILDGGKPQLSAGLTVWRKLSLSIPLTALAKREEILYLPEPKEGYREVRFERASPALHIIQKIRDEAHRFAITYHRKLRGKRMLGGGRVPPK
ncbi:MAG: excinuclease ABC subunit UvrC [Parcubacteria group bacterium]|nr:excinuclease ABC subunit UvrC [Parcubacteria group bacterium]